MLDLRELLRPYVAPRPCPSRLTPLEERLASAIDYYPDSAEACWEWRAASDARGYGHITVQGHTRLVHRVVYEILVGPIPEGLTLDHLCRNPSCCNPAHLEPVDHRTNVLRGESFVAVQARKTHCKYGHALEGANVYRRPEAPNRRQCVACRGRWQSEH